MEHLLAKVEKGKIQYKGKELYLRATEEMLDSYEGKLCLISGIESNGFFDVYLTPAGVLESLQCPSSQ